MQRLPIHTVSRPDKVENNSSPIPPKRVSTEIREAIKISMSTHPSPNSLLIPFVSGWDKGRPNFLQTSFNMKKRKENQYFVDYVFASSWWILKKLCLGADIGIFITSLW